MNIYVTPIIPVLIEAHMTQQKLERQKHRATRYPTTLHRPPPVLCRFLHASLTDIDFDTTR